MATASHLGRLHRRALASSIPLSVHLELTHDCNLSCGFCCNPPRTGRAGLGLDLWRDVLDDLRELGTLMVTVTGGEPLLHPDFTGIMREIQKRRFAVRILSNGTLIGDHEAEFVAELRPLAVEVSIHGSDATTHDRTTGVQGSYRAAWAGIERLQRSDVRVVVKTPISELNVHQIVDIRTLAEGRGLPIRFDPTMTPRDDGCLDPISYSASPEDIRTAWVAAAGSPPSPLCRRTGEVNCGVGRITLTIDPEGEIYPCSQWRTSSLGNVSDEGLAEIWSSSMERRRVGAIARAANERLIEIGGDASEHPYCPAVAARFTGDPLEPDDGFLSLARVAAELRRNR